MPAFMVHGGFWYPEFQDLRYYFDLFMEILNHFDPYLGQLWQLFFKFELSDLDDLTVIQAILISSKAISNTKSYQYRIIDP